MSPQNTASSSHVYMFVSLFAVTHTDRRPRRKPRCVSVSSLASCFMKAKVKLGKGLIREQLHTAFSKCISKPALSQFCRGVICVYAVLCLCFCCPLFLSPPSVSSLSLSRIFLSRLSFLQTDTHKHSERMD